VSASHSMTLSKLDEMGLEFDKPLKLWKEELESHGNSTKLLLGVQEFVSTTKSEKEFVPPGFQTTNVGGLGLSFPDLLDSDPQQECQPTAFLLQEEKLKNWLTLTFPEFSESSIDNTVKVAKQQCSEVKDLERINLNHAKEKPPSYHIIGDNVDLYVKVKHMNSERQNRSIHWFALNAVQDRVSGIHLAVDKPIRSILDMENIEFLPSRTDNENLLHDFIPLFARAVIGKIPAFSCFKDVKVKHIPHRYSQEMKQKSSQVNLKKAKTVILRIPWHYCTVCMILHVSCNQWG